MLEYIYAMHVGIIAPHPDDELFCAGFLLSFPVSFTKVIVVTDGSLGFSKFEPFLRGEKLIEKRYSETEAFCRELNIAKPTFLDHKDQGINTKLLKAQLKLFIQKLDLNLILCPHWSELHPDHKITAKCVAEVFHQLRNEHPFFVFFYFTDPALQESYKDLNTEFWRVELDREKFERKKALCQLYETQRHFLPYRMTEIERYWRELDWES